MLDFLGNILKTVKDSVVFVLTRVRDGLHHLLGGCKGSEVKQPEVEVEKPVTEPHRDEKEDSSFKLATVPIERYVPVNRYKFRNKDDLLFFKSFFKHANRLKNLTQYSVKLIGGHLFIADAGPNDLIDFDSEEDYELYVNSVVKNLL